MATFAATFQAGPNHCTNTTVNAGAHGEIKLGLNAIFAIQATGNVTISFIDSTSTGDNAAVATTNDWLVAQGAIEQWDMGSRYDTVSVFNGGGSAVTVQTWLLSRN